MRFLEVSTLIAIKFNDFTNLAKTCETNNQEKSCEEVSKVKFTHV